MFCGRILYRFCLPKTFGTLTVSEEQTLDKALLCFIMSFAATSSHFIRYTGFRKIQVASNNERNAFEDRLPS